MNVQKVTSSWYVWLFPIIAIAICAYLFFQTMSHKGPKIKISFDDASSIQAEKTRVRFRGVVIGTVKNVYISENRKETIAEVALEKESENFAVEGSKFWVVTPKVGLQGVTGLETIFEGTYIAVQPGNPDGDQKLEFKGRMGHDATESNENATGFVLETPNTESISLGDSVTFRGLVVGSITEVTLAKGGQMVNVQIHIQNRYVHLVRTNTVFWRKVGVQAKLGLFNSEIKVNSLDSIMHGGVEFFTPDNPGERAKAQTKFGILQAPPKGSEKWNPKLD